MPDPSSALVAVGSNIISGSMQADAAADAAGIQAGAAQAGIDEQRRQFDAIRQLLAPYVNAGTGALGQQQAIVGLGGPEAERAALERIQNSPSFLAAIQQGENAMLQNASATGGLRGGNLQGAMAQFRPALLSQAINDQYGKFAGLTSLGQNAAAGVGNAGMQTGANVANLLGQQGQAQAGGALGEAKGIASIFSAIPQGLGAYYGQTGRSPFGGFGGGGSSMGSFDTGVPSVPYGLGGSTVF